MNRKADKWNWAMLFTAIFLIAAFLGARPFVMELDGGHHYSGLVGMIYMLWSGVACFGGVVLVCAVTKQSAALKGFGIAILLALPALLATSLSTYLLGFFLAKIAEAGVRSPVFNPYDLRLILPIILIVFAFVRNAKKKETFQQSHAEATSETAPSAASDASDA